MVEYILLVVSGFVAWIVSTVGGGGGALLLVPLVGFIAGAQAVAPVTTLATMVAGGGRAFVFWRD
ncbi:MAG: sulfite exporter TauE/SafE family protein, partial [Mesorhizobium sp.]